jgi:adenosylhomocysteine nucleosidase
MELEGLTSRLVERGHHFHESQIGPLRVLEFRDIGFRLALAGHGKTQFGIQAQFLIDRLKPDSVICAGCAGGLSESLSIFDVVVAEKTIEHDYRLKFIQRPDPEFPGDQALITKIKAVRPSGFGVRSGVIASGDEDIVDSSRAAELRAQTGAIAVAWEGAGGARAAKFNKIPFIELRGVTDTANNSAPVDFKENLKVAMANVCDVFLAAFV